MQRLTCPPLIGPSIESDILEQGHSRKLLKLWLSRTAFASTLAFTAYFIYNDKSLSAYAKYSQFTRSVITCELDSRKVTRYFGVHWLNSSEHNQLKECLLLRNWNFITQH